MARNALERVREDLASMQAAIGGPAFGAADVRFFAALSATAGIFAVCHALGAASGWPLWLSGAPAILACAAYMGYIALRSRPNADVNWTRRHEYRTTLVILLPVVAMALAMRHWSVRAGIAHLQFGGVLLVSVGIGVCVMGITNVRPARYPRAYLLAAGLPMVAAGLLCPFCTRTQGTILVSGLAAVMFGLEAIVVHYHLREQAEVTDAAD